MKNTIKFMLAGLLAISLGSALVACDKTPAVEAHEHTFSSEWSSNEGSHWHAATCEHSDLSKDMANHTFGNWETDREPTETEEGLKHRVCSVCGYRQEAGIAEKQHQHTFLNTWESDDDYHWHVASCHVGVVSGMEAHDYSEWSTDSEPTETQPGVQSRTCSVCEHVQYREIEKPGHAHTYAEEWSYDSDNHWHAATCEHADSKDSFGGHVFGEWGTISDSTESEHGIKQRVCSTCGYVDEEELPLAPHQHTFSTDWANDGLYHWHPSTCGHADAVSGKEEHDFGSWIIDDQSTATNPGAKHRICETCGYREDAELALEDHVHTYNTASYSYDGNYHWHEATCGHKVTTDMARHTPGAAATYTTVKKCTVCNAVLEDTLYNNAIGMDGNQHNIDSSRPVQLFKVNVFPQSNERVSIRFKVTTGYGGPAPQISMKLVKRTYNNGSATFEVIKHFGTHDVYLGSNTYYSDSFVTEMLPVTTNISYFVEVERICTGSGVLYVTLTNQTYEYVSTLYDYFTAKLSTGNVRYNVYKYVAQNGVDHEYWKVVNTSTGETVGTFQDAKVRKNPNVLVDGLVELYDDSGNKIELVVPRTIYETDSYNTRTAFYVDEYYDNYYYFCYDSSHLDKSVGLYMDDAIYGQPDLFETDDNVSAEEKYYGMMAYLTDALPSFYIHNPGYTDSNQFDADYDEAPFGLKDSVADCVTNYTHSNLTAVVDMSYNATNRRFSFQNEWASTWQSATAEYLRVLKVDNGNDLIFDRFISYANSALTSKNNPNATNWAYQYRYTILDENFREISGYDLMETEGFKHNAAGENINLLQNTTYYIVINNWLARYAFAVEQRQYSITTHCVDEAVLSAVGETEPQSQVIFSNCKTGDNKTLKRDTFSNVVDNARATAGYIFVGYSYQPTSTRIDYIPEQTITVWNADVDLYARYIRTDNVITTRNFCPTSLWGHDGDKLVLTTAIIDDDLDLMPYDAILFHNQNGTGLEEHYITSIATDGARKVLTLEAGSYVSSAYNNLKNVAYITLETEFEIICAAWEHSNFDDAYIVDKGDEFTLPDADTYCNVEDGYYLDHWQADEEEELKFYDFTTITPRRSMWLDAVVVAINGSGLLTKYNEFTVGENASGLYAEFTIKDANAATATLLSGASASNVIIVLKNNTEYSDSVAKIINSSNQTVNSATNGTGVIRVYFNGITRAELETAVMIKMA